KHARPAALPLTRMDQGARCAREHFDDRWRNGVYGHEHAAATNRYVTTVPGRTATAGVQKLAPSEQYREPLQRVPESAANYTATVWPARRYPRNDSALIGQVLSSVPHAC